jgi:hypothetical protein
MMPREKLRKADLVAGSALVLLGGAVLVASLRMPTGGTYGGERLTWYLSPAAFPALVGILMMAAAFAIVVRAAREGALDGAKEYFLEGARAALRSREARRSILIVILLVCYVLALRLHVFGWVGHLLRRVPGAASTGLTRFCLEPSGANYVLASALFLGSFMGIFYRPVGGPLRRRHVGLIVGLSIGVSYVVGYLFREQLLVPLP